jgi:uncharacterized protein (UPF0276 family)
VNSVNHRFDPNSMLEMIPQHMVKEIHLAGHARNEDILIDDHGSKVSDAVWYLYVAACARFGQVPTLIEWDTDVPALDVLLSEAKTAFEKSKDHAVL